MELPLIDLPPPEYGDDPAQNAAHLLLRLGTLLDVAGDRICEVRHWLRNWMAAAVTQAERRLDQSPGLFDYQALLRHAVDGRGEDVLTFRRELPDPVDVLHQAEDRVVAKLMALAWLEGEQAAEVGDVLAEAFAELREEWSMMTLLDCPGCSARHEVAFEEAADGSVGTCIRSGKLLRMKDGAAELAAPFACQSSASDARVVQHQHAALWDELGAVLRRLKDLERLSPLHQAGLRLVKGQDLARRLAAAMPELESVASGMQAARIFQNLDNAVMMLESQAELVKAILGRELA